MRHKRVASLRVLRVAVVIVTAVVASCSLFVDTDGLADKAAVDGSSPGVDGGDGGNGSNDGAPPNGNDGGTDASDASIDPTLVGEWLFDEDGGTMALDTSGNGRNGLIIQGARVAGRTRGALEFDGGGGHVVISPSKEFDRAQTSSFTILTWLKPTAPLGHTFLFSISFGERDTAFGLEVTDNSHINYYAGETDAGPQVAHVATSQVPLAFGKWSHIAVVVDKGSGVKMYFDGVLVGAGTADNTPRTATQVLIGKNNYGALLTGVIDSVRFYSRALTDQEVLADRDRADK
jgi:hypothetical protein